jgi:mannobiose 2-epimerase
MTDLSWPHAAVPASPPTAQPDLDWAARLRREVEDNVLPWWRDSLFGPDGSVLGGRANDGAELDVPRSAVLVTRLLWTFSSAQTRLAPDPRNAQAAHRAWDWLRLRQVDATHGGVFWSVDARGEPVARHKQVYAQAFAVYALTAYHRMLCVEAGIPASADSPPLDLAMQLMALVEAHAHDPLEGGYFEGCTPDWQALPGARLSALEPPAPKSTNTSLHVLEAWTELLRCRRSDALADRLRQLVEIFLTRLWLPQQRCFGLFFDREWNNLTPQVSWGHDIEAAWLLVRACDVLGDGALRRRAVDLSLLVADAVFARGLHDDGSLLGAGTFDGQVTDDRRHWWAQAEAMVGFWDAWQHRGRARHADAARRNWGYIERHHVDREGGDWFKVLDARGRAMPEVPKAGPWECPYHHVRACLEMNERLLGKPAVV